MRRRVRPLPLLLAVLVGLLLVVGLRLALVVDGMDPEDIAARLRDEARARTGHDLTVEGLEVDLLPPRLTLTGLSLGPAPGFGPEPFAQAARVRATFRLLPLLRRRLEVGSVRVDGLRIELVRGPTGRGSWETLREHLGQERGQAEEGVDGLPGFSVRGAHLRYRDLGTGRTVEVDDLSLRLGRPRGQRPRALALDGALHLSNTEVEGHLSARASLLAPPGSLVTLRGLVLEAAATAGGRRLALRGGGDLEIDTTRAHLSASSLALHLEASGEGLPEAPVTAELGGLLRVDLEGGRLWLEELTVDAAGMRADGALAVEGLPETPAVTGRAVLSHQDLGAALTHLGHPLALNDPAALRDVSATVPFRWSAGVLAVDDLDLRLGEARVTGDLTARGLHPPDLGFDLDASGLDLDRLRPSDGGGAWPPAGLDAAQVAGRLRGHDLRLGGATLDYLDLPLALSSGRLQVAGASVTALGGGLRFDLDTDLVRIDGQQRAQAELVTLDLARVLEALGSDRGLTGTAQAHGDLGARGFTADSLRGSLDGDLCIALIEGILPLERGSDGDTKGRPLRAKRAGHAARELSGVTARVVALARERVGGQVPTELTYHRIAACFDLEGGVASTADLRLDADELKLQGAGQIDLGAGTMDLTCLVTLGELLPMGMHVYGSLEDPVVELDKPERMDLVRGLVEHRREERREKVQEQRQALRAGLRSAGAEGVDALLDQRERVIERREEAREQVREEVQDVRDAARERRQGVREKIKEKLGKDVEEGAVPAEGEEAQEVPAPAADPS